MRIGPLTFFEKKQIDLDVDFEELFASAPTAAGIAVSRETALRVPAVASAIRTISESAASLEVKIVEIGADGTETEVFTHPARHLLRDEANAWTSSFEMIRQLVVDALTFDVGALAYVNWINGEPVEIIRYKPGVLAADLTQETGEPIYRINGRLIPAQNIVHIRTAFDKSPVTLAREAIGVALTMERHAARLFGSGARPGGIIKTAKQVGDEGVKKMLKGWKAAHEGPENSGKTAVLWDGADWQQVTLSSVDAQFQELRLFQLQEIARAFNIPASMLGDLSRATWSNSEEMGRQYLVLTLEPWLQAIEGGLRRALFLPEERKRLAVRFDRDDLTRADIGDRATAYSKLIASRVINPNTARKWEGIEPYPEGEDYFNPHIGDRSLREAPDGSERS